MLLFKVPFPLDGGQWGRFGEPLDLESRRGLEEGWQLLLGDVDLTSVHELQDGLQVKVGDVFENDDGVL